MRRRLRERQCGREGLELGPVGTHCGDTRDVAAGWHRKWNSEDHA
jgi:hypothetical protein